jgi:hypothetical protein
VLRISNVGLLINNTGEFSPDGKSVAAGAIDSAAMTRCSFGLARFVGLFIDLSDVIEQCFEF